MRNYILFLIVLLFMIGCASNNPVITQQQREEVQTLVTTKSFKIDSEWAFPRVTSAMISLQNAGFFPNNSTASMIDISAHDNYFIMDKDTVDAKLPYYGERQFGAAYDRTNGGGIAFKGVPENVVTTKTKNGYKINFRIRGSNDRTETYRVNILVYDNLRARINIFSSHRLTIEYRGKVTDIPNKEGEES